MWLKVSTAVTLKLGPFLDDTDGKTAETALTISQADVRLSKNGGAFAQKNDASSATHDEVGWYGVPLNTTDTNTLGRLRIAIHESGALPVWEHYMVLPANVFDALVSGTDFLDTEVAAMAANTLTASALATDAVTEIQNGLATPTNITAGTITTATNVTTVNGLAANVITAAAIAADAIGASELAADAVAEIADAVWDEVITGAAHNTTNSAGRRLRQLSAASIRDGIAQAGTSNSITLDTGASATDEIYDSNLIVIVDGTGAGQSRVIVEYNGTSKVAIVDRTWEVNPDAASEFEIIADHQASITHHGLAQAGAASTITLSTTASAQDDIYNTQTIVIGTSAGTGQSRTITDYDGTTKIATVSPAWAINPGANSVYSILPAGQTIVHDFSTTAQATINAQVLDVLTVDTFAELSAVPAATSTLKDKINWLFALARNKITQSATTQALRNDADGADIATSATSDSGTVFTRGEWS